jgi:hypothetical protein
MNNNAKYAFYYLLSLVALIFVSINSGIIVFQLINHFIPDTLSNYSDSVSQEMIRFAIASLIFATPVFYWMQMLINQGLVKKDIALAAPIRRWLTYLIIFISSVVILVWLIMTTTSFLNGELTLKAILKTLTILLIAGSVFGYYFYDIRKDKVASTDLVRRIFWIASLAIIAGIFVSALCVMDKPSVVRSERQDQNTLSDLMTIDSAINQYYAANKQLPVDLSVLVNSAGIYLREESLTDDSSQAYRYQVLTAESYQLCANFKLATDRSDKFNYSEPRWDHQAGEDCFDLVLIKSAEAPIITPIK